MHEWMDIKFSRENRQWRKKIVVVMQWAGKVVEGETCYMPPYESMYLCARLFRMKNFLIKKKAQNERNMIIIKIFQLVDALPKAFMRKCEEAKVHNSAD